jgi:hypothetical protein
MEEPAHLSSTRKTVEDELSRIESRTAHVDRLELNRDADLNYYAQIVPESLDALEPDERNRVSIAFIR